MPHRGAAARAEGQVLALLVLLDQVQGNLVGGDDHPAGGRLADGEPADLAGGRHVALEQGRRQGQGAGVVVEAEPIRRVGGNPLADVDVEVEEVADDVAVLGLVQPVEREGSARIRLRLGRRVQLVLEPTPEPVVGGLVGARARLRGHGPDAQLPHDGLPDLGVLGDVVDIDRVERQPHRAELRNEHRPRLVGARHDRAVVAGDAVPVEERPLGRDRRRRRPRRGLPRRRGRRRADDDGDDRRRQSAEETPERRRLLSCHGMSPNLDRKRRIAPGASRSGGAPTARQERPKCRPRTDLYHPALRDGIVSPLSAVVSTTRPSRNPPARRGSRAPSSAADDPTAARPRPAEPRRGAPGVPPRAHLR